LYVTEAATVPPGPLSAKLLEPIVAGSSASLKVAVIAADAQALRQATAEVQGVD